MSDDANSPREYASPACFAHELDGESGRIAAVDAETRRDVTRWRKAERQRLYRMRETLTDAQRERAGNTLAAALDELLAERDITCVSAYWPIRHEPDLRAWMRQTAMSGLQFALPVIEAEGEPLKFARWRPGDSMRRGRWGIAEPAAFEWLLPELLIVPLLGVDENRFRLGNGGGYYDRTLAAASPRPLAVGVGYHHARIDTIYPLPHDIPLDLIVTG